MSPWRFCRASRMGSPMLEQDKYAYVRSMARLMLSSEMADGVSSFSEHRIAEVVKSANVALGAPIADTSKLVAELEATFQTVIGAERALREDSWTPWLAKKKADISWDFWTRYREYLSQEKAWSPTTVDRLDRVTDRILDYLNDPAVAEPWDRRGLVVGHVQSGKTSNYIGLITKAADAGYKIIVVLAGFHKSLRSQTQIRLEEGFLGYDMTSQDGGASGSRAPVGVGKVELYGKLLKADSITTRADDGDFKRAVAKNFAINPGGNPLLFVIKKNGSVLRNLLNWVIGVAPDRDENGRRYIKGVPLLVIDDEADQGSIDTNKIEFDENGEPDHEHDPTILNRRIRQLLHMFDQSAYVGYTATPFANILIHEGQRTEREGLDLFPRSFIVSLPAASNYVGPATVFGLADEDGLGQPLPIIRTVTDHANSLELDEREGWVPPKHDKFLHPMYAGEDRVPPSLGEAIRAFILVCAARTARGDATAHNSMLIHVTRFTAVQDHVVEQVMNELADIQRRLRYGEGASSHRIRTELRQLWERDFEATTAAMHDRREALDCSALTWNQVERGLERSALSVDVRAINGLAGEVLDYVQHEATGLNVIAVGGDKLSRGLTLEGLSISYFLRASRMYDTLMQMGRWFGYRPRFLDLCRLYTTPEMIDWFSHIAAASEELRDDFNRMALSGGTPVDFGHRVRSHPLMMVTSAVKMRSGTTIDVTFSGDISETINFRRNRLALEQNWRAGIKLLESIRAAGIGPEAVAGGNGNQEGPWLFRNVSPEAIVDFLTDYTEHSASIKVKTRLLADYIEAEQAHGRLTSWTIFLAAGSAKEVVPIGGVTTRLVERRWHASEGPEREQLIAADHFRIRRLVSPTNEGVDLTQDQLEAARRDTVAAWKLDPGSRSEPKRPDGTYIRNHRPATNGLLLLYPLWWGDRSEMRVEANAYDTPILGFAISFPTVAPRDATRVQYVVNNVYWSQELVAPTEFLDDEE